MSRSNIYKNAFDTIIQLLNDRRQLRALLRIVSDPEGLAHYTREQLHSEFCSVLERQITRQEFNILFEALTSVHDAYMRDPDGFIFCKSINLF